jgi:dsRNA-specific ribonuclease
LLSYPIDGVTVEGPDNAPLHTVTCCVEGYPPFHGTARRKLDAESAAAEAALLALQAEKRDTPAPTDNPRVRIKEWADKQKRTLAFTTEETGDRPVRYRSVLSIDGRAIATGEGFSKKEAERAAAAYALEHRLLFQKGETP